ncbi:MAG: glycosyltransferase [Cyanobacteriota bacterium]|nr:glycosyltransferase [Cyanobacteriota bacterium]
MRAYRVPALSLATGDPLFLSLVIPTYNEAHNLKPLIAQLSQLLDPILANQYELVVVDDDSPDQTWQVAEFLRAEYPALRVLRRQGDRGLATAVLQGWQLARGQVLGVIDGDLQHPPHVLLDLVAAMQAGSDLAVASRHVEGGGVSQWSVERRIISRGAQLIGLILLPGILGRVTDPLSGFFLVRRTAIAGRDLYPFGYKILIEVLGRGSISQISEVGYVFQERQEGESKISLQVYGHYLQHLLYLRLSLWPILRFLRFGLVGCSGVLVDMSLLYLLHDATGWGFGLVASKLVAAECAILNNFLWNDLWTFRDITRKQPGSHNRLKRLVKFNVICLLGLGINSLLLIMLTDGLGIHYLLANLLAIATVMFWNFYLNLHLSWRVTDVRRELRTK